MKSETPKVTEADRREYYILSMKWTGKGQYQDHVTFWRPNNSGYTVYLDSAGRYAESELRGDIKRLPVKWPWPEGTSESVAVPCEIVDRMAQHWLPNEGEVLAALCRGETTERYCRAHRPERDAAAKRIAELEHQVEAAWSAAEEESWPFEWDVATRIKAERDKARESLKSEREVAAKLKNRLSELGVCPECLQEWEHDVDEPLARCGCSQSEWATPVSQFPLIFRLRYTAAKLAEALEQDLADAEFIIEACDGECYCDAAMIIEGHEPCAVCQCIAAANAIRQRVGQNLAEWKEAQEK